ncbi:MAG: amidohydrolase family protein [Candidatus Hodarchaeota archaeon]
MGQLVLKVDKAITPTKELMEVAIIIEKNRIKKLVPWNEITQNKNVLYYPNTIAAPGFIDIHIHGHGTCDANSGKESCLINMSKSLSRHGVTSFLPTTVTQSQDDLLRICQIMKKVVKKEGNGAEILGLRLEGPYIGKGKKAGA